MRVAILGATGQTGTQAVQQALDAGHTVTAIVRNPSKLKIVDDQLKVAEADIFNVESLKTHFEGCDAVISCLGFPTTAPVEGYTMAAKAIVGAMRVNNITRLIVEHSWYTCPKSRENASFFLRWVLFPIIKNNLNNMRETEQWLEAEAQDIDYTVTLPAGLSNDPVTDKEFTVVENGFMVPGCGSRIARADVARFMLGAINKQDTFKKIVAIGV